MTECSVDTTLTPDEIYAVGHSSFQKFSLIGHHITSCNDLYENGLKRIIEDYFTISHEQKINSSESKVNSNINKVYVDITFSNVTLKRPMISTSSGMVPAYPNKVLNDGGSYAGALHITLTIKMKVLYNDGTETTKTEVIPDRNIGSIPIMVGSNMCNLRNTTIESKYMMNEDTRSLGGEFVINGGVWAIIAGENIKYNELRMYYNLGHQNQVCNCHMISKPGDGFENSSEIIVIMTKNYELTARINIAPYKDVDFPFYVLFRIMGWYQDEKIVSYIIPGYKVDTAENIQMRSILERCFSADYKAYGTNMLNEHDPINIIKMLYTEHKNLYTFDFEKPGQVNNAVEKFMNFFDKNILTHIGNSKESRNEKLINLADIFRKALITVITKRSTDRDTYSTKRIIAAGYALGKPTKSYYNTAFIMKIRAAIVRTLKTKDIKDINLSQDFAIRVLDAGALGRLLEKEITNGANSVVQITPTTSKVKRIPTRSIQPKNHMNIINTGREVGLNTGNIGKTSSRATEIRSIHPSATGYICCIASPEGENVGLNKSMTIFSIISDASSKKVLLDKIVRDPDLIPLSKVTPDIRFIQGLNNVYVSGTWVGCVVNGLSFIKKYKIKRRAKEIHYMTTIQWNYNSNEVHFWPDYGRIMHPMFIVYNNIDNPEMFKTKDKYQQGILYNKEMFKKLVRGEINFEYLINNGVIEYIAPEEKENNLIAVDINKLSQHEHDILKQYHYCDIPENLLGLSSLNAPYGHHSAPIRVTYETSHCKQSCGIPLVNFRHCNEKELYVASYSRNPVCRTVANEYIRPSGEDILVAYNCFTGLNQEDSIIVNQGAIDRGAFFMSKYMYMLVEVENNETIGTPGENTVHIKSKNSYKKLVGGIIPIKTYVENGDVLVAKTVTVTDHNKKSINVDKSVVYNDMEPGYVYRIHKSVNDDSNVVYKIHIQKIRPVQVGDKFSSRHGQKGVVSITMRDSDIPFTKEGMIPHIIINPHGMPSRMTIGQIYELVLGMICSLKGCTMDTTYFRNTDPNLYGPELKSLGHPEYSDYETYNPHNGVKFDNKIVMGIVHYLRLQKFAIDNVGIVGSSATTDPIFKQPTSGARKGGGARFGTMEMDVMFAQGAGNVARSKHWHDSDGYYMYVCTNCSQFAVVNEGGYNKKDKTGTHYSCKLCGTMANIVKINTYYSSNVLLKIMRGMNIGTKLIMEPVTFEEQN